MQITRREFSSMLAGSALATITKPFPISDSPKWNVLIITNDQHRADCLGCMGNPVIRTSNTDRLGKEGVIFEQHFVQAPQCVPSRAALHTGRYPHVNRTPTNIYRLPETEETLANILSRNGYATATVGELPFAPTKFLGGLKVFADDSDYHAFLESAGWRGNRVSPARRALLREYEMRSQKQFQASAAPWPEELDETPFYAAKAIEFLKENSRQPFYLHVNFRRPHHPFDPPAPFDRMYEGTNFPQSHKMEGEMQNKPPAQQKALEDSVGFDLRTLTEGDLNRIKSYYYGMISENDKYIGLIIDQLPKLGIDDRTLVIFNSDHGEMLGDHGLVFKGGYFYDQVVQAPLIIRAPKRLPAGKRIKTVVEEIDVLPTILDLLNIKISKRIQGRSLLPLVNGTSTSSRAAHSEFPNAKMLRTEHWKLVHYLHAPYGELYNLREDPFELRNLFDDPGAVRARHEMESALADWLIDSNDPSLKPVQVEKEQ